MAVKITGVIQTSGKQAYGTSLVAEWLPLFIKLVKKRLNVDLAIIQAQGSAAASAGTHKDGSAVDTRSWNFVSSLIRPILLLAREAGGWAWYRTKAQGFADPHIHIAVDHGRGVSTSSSYQVDAARAGYNGLGSGGKSGKDDGPRPAVMRTAREGIAWMKAQLGLPATTPTLPATGVNNVPPTSKDDDMTPDQANQLAAVYKAVAERAGIERAGESAARQTVNYPVHRSGKQFSMLQEIADAKSNTMQLLAQMAGLTQAVSVLSGSIAKLSVGGGSIDPKALAAEVEKAAQTGAANALKNTTFTASTK